MLKRVLFFLTPASALMLVFLLTSTTPASTGPLGILGFFVFMYLTALGVLTFLFKAISAVLSRATSSMGPRSRVRALSLRDSYYYASVLALAPVMLIALQSVGRVGPYQVSLVVFFVVVAWVYVANRII